MVLLTACGYVGDPQYPALRIPVAVSNLTVVQQGEKLQVGFTIPPKTTEGLLVQSVGEVDLRIGPGVTPWDIGAWAESATRVDVKSPQNLGSVEALVPAEQFVGHSVVIAVRLSNSKGRLSAWSNLVPLTILPALPKPSGLTVKGTAEGVLVQWRSSDTPEFRVFRSSESAPQPLAIGMSDKQEYLDTTAGYGAKYDYFVQGINGAQQSDTSGPVSIATKDTFPPAIPANLTATPGVDAVELAWERNSESDFRGYRVYRASGAAPFQLIADLIDAPNFSDRKAEPGKRYVYAVTAVDRVGNESNKTPTIEVILP